MEISKELKEFLNIPFNQQLMDDGLFDALYETIEDQENMDVTHISEFTNLLYEININPLRELPFIPAGYLFMNNNPKITSITIPNHIKEIRKYAFYELGSNCTIYVPNSVERIGEHAFDSPTLTIVYDGTMREFLDKCENGTITAHDTKLIFK